MQKTVIADASCIILFDKIDELLLLRKLFGFIYTTPEIASEFGKPLPDWIIVHAPKDKNYQAIIEAHIDKGEASAIALAIEYQDCTLIIDEQKGRKFAIALGLKITGSFGVIIECKLSGHIPSVKPILSKIKQTNFRFTESLEHIVLSKAGEW
jgi:predicted nucleic acid-binding protein